MLNGFLIVNAQQRTTALTAIYNLI